MPVRSSSIPGFVMGPGHTRALVGRASEVAELEAALERLAAGGQWFVQLVGEPGIGKSRLLAELRRRGEDRGYLVLDGRAAEFERDVPFGLIVDALNDYLGSLDPAILAPLEGDPLRELAAIFPSLPRPERGEQPAAQGAERYRLHYAIRAVLERLTARQPMVLALDDLHWADAASIEMLTHLLRRFRGPLLTAVAYRAANTRHLAAFGSGAPGGLGTRIDLLPLSSEDTGRLIGSDVDEATRALLYRESGGNPFYVEQLARGRSLRGLRPARASGRARDAIPPAVIAAIDEELIARLGGVSAGARGCGRRRRIVRTRAGRRNRRAQRAGRTRLTRRASECRLHPSHRRAAALSLPPSDRAPGGVRRDTAWLADRRPCPGGRGAGGRPRSRDRPGAPR